MTALFNAKAFNAEAFGKYVESIPKTRLNALIGAGVLQADPAIQDAFAGKTGMDRATVPMFGRAVGYDQTYDGSTAISVGNTSNTYTRTAQVLRKAGAWTEKDFSYDITGGVDFLSQMGAQIADHKQDLVQDILISTLYGIFDMPSTVAQNGVFVSKHTLDITEATNPKMSASTMGTAIQKACGDKRSKFSLGAFSSKIVSDLEAINAVDYLKQTDINGMTRELSMGTWNGKTIVEDDGMPVYEAGTYRKVESTTVGALKVLANTATPTAGEIKLEDVDETMFGFVPKAGDYVKTYDKDLYTSYVMGDGAFGFMDVGAKVPFEAYRQPLIGGGQDSLISRVGFVIAPYGFTFLNTGGNPTLTTLADGAKWSLAEDNTDTTGGATKSYFPHKDIPIARILSLA